MSAILTGILIEVAAKVGAPIVKKILLDKVGGVAGQLGGTVIDAIATKAGVPPEELQDLPRPQLEEAVAAVEQETPDLVLAYNERLKLSHDLMLAENAGTAQARATAAIRATDAPSSRRIVTEPTMISGRLAFLIDGSETGGSTITAANSIGSSGAGRTNLPCRAIVLQVDRWFGFNPYRSATSFTIAPGRRLSETICALTASGHCR